MATTYTWDIENVTILEAHNGNEKVVSRVVWKCTATNDTGTSKSQIGVVDLDVNNISTDFVPASQVTKQQIIDWVTAKVPKAMIENDLMPETTTVSFLETGLTATITDQIAAFEARQNIS
jgi:hypothetical protein